ncbi:GFA family protein [Rhodovibrionaceae bacterium A322]
MTEIRQGACFCGAVKVQVTGDAVLQGYCHCDDCRHWSGAPVTAYSLWPADLVKVTAGEQSLRRYSKAGKSTRLHCSGCGGAVITEMPAAGMVDVYPPLLEDLPFAPTMHVYYAERVLDLPDGLPKFRDMPAAAGGSDEIMAE